MPRAFWRIFAPDAVVEQWRVEGCALAREVAGRFADADQVCAWALARGFGADDAAAAAESWEQAVLEEDFDENVEELKLPVAALVPVTPATAVAPIAPPSEICILKMAARSRKRAPPACRLNAGERVRGLFSSGRDGNSLDFSCDGC